MSMLNYQNGVLHAEAVALTELAEQHGTPCYVYSRAAIERAFANYRDALAHIPHLICYAVKANSSLAVLNLLAARGSGFDVVSAGELQRVLAAGGSAGKVVFSGVGKTRQEIRYALEQEIKCFNVESEAELLVIQQEAQQLGRRAPISLRVNPDVDANTHPYISTGLKENKFGVAFEDARRVYRLAADQAHLDLVGIDCHIGSQLTDTAPFLAALERLLVLVDEIAEDGIALKHIDIGGGLGVRYKDEAPPSPQDYLGQVVAALGDRPLTLLVEPGRSIVANAGVLLSEVLYLKSNGSRQFAIVDAAMNDLIRPSLYQAWCDVMTVLESPGHDEAVYDVVGPICESTDFLAKQRALKIQAGELLAVCSAGAYGFVMSSNYNTRPRAAEIMVDGHNTHLVRPRESFSQLIQGEAVLPDSGLPA